MYGKDYLQKAEWETWEVIEKNLAPKFKNLMTICGLSEVSTKYQTISQYLYIQKKLKTERQEEKILQKYKLTL